MNGATENDSLPDSRMEENLKKMWKKKQLYTFYISLFMAG